MGPRRIFWAPFSAFSSFLPSISFQITSSFSLPHPSVRPSNPAHAVLLRRKDVFSRTIAGGGRKGKMTKYCQFIHAPRLGVALLCAAAEDSLKDHGDLSKRAASSHFCDGKRGGRGGAALQPKIPLPPISGPKSRQKTPANYP